MVRDLSVRGSLNRRIGQFASEAAKQLAVKLNEEIERGHDTGPFMIAVFISAVIDFQDIVLGIIALLIDPAAGVGLFFDILAAIIGTFGTVFLTIFLWGKGWFLRTRIRIIWWVFGFIVENLPAISILPMNTLVVLYAWHIVRKRGRAAEDKLDKLSKMTSRQIQEFNEDISLLDGGESEVEERRLVTREATIAASERFFPGEELEISEGAPTTETVGASVERKPAPGERSGRASATADEAIQADETGSWEGETLAEREARIYGMPVESLSPSERERLFDVPTEDQFNENAAPKNVILKGNEVNLKNTKKAP